MEEDCRGLEFAFLSLKACRRLVEVRRVGFVRLKACKRLTDDGSERIDIRNACMRIAKFLRVHFDHRKP